jgi:predicted PurR-regulated permease PerM
VLVWTEKRGWPRWIGVTASAVLLCGFVALLLGVLIPTLTTQVTGLIKHLPTVREEAVKHLPDSGPARETVAKLLDSAWFSNPEPLLASFLQWGRIALEALVQFLVVIVIAIYLLIDGERVYHWLLAFFPQRHRHKTEVAVPEIASVVCSYMTGQLITSLLCGCYAFAVLWLLKVPNAALLAVLAAIFDVLPLIGFFVSLLPAIGMALTVSPVTAALVAGLYIVYHAIESYLIVPKVYGHRLRLSTLTVLVSCMAGALVAGVIGAIAVLPIVASYPIIERIWLRPHLESDTVAKHKEIDEKEHPTA